MPTKPRRLFASDRLSRYWFDRVYSRSLTSQRHRNRALRRVGQAQLCKSRRHVFSRVVALVQRYFAHRKAA